MDAAERLAYEYCEDVARIGVVYAEVRFAPQRLLGPELASQLGFEGEVELHCGPLGDCLGPNYCETPIVEVNTANEVYMSEQLAMS